MKTEPKQGDMFHAHAQCIGFGWEGPKLVCKSSIFVVTHLRLC